MSGFKTQDHSFPSIKFNKFIVFLSNFKKINLCQEEIYLYAHLKRNMNFGLGNEEFKTGDGCSAQICFKVSKLLTKYL